VRDGEEWRFDETHGRVSNAFGAFLIVARDTAAVPPDLAERAWAAMPTAVAAARFLSDYDWWWWRSKGRFTSRAALAVQLLKNPSPQGVSQNSQNDHRADHRAARLSFVERRKCHGFAARTTPVRPRPWRAAARAGAQLAAWTPRKAARAGERVGRRVATAPNSWPSGGLRTVGS
jgi:hypothetical protein